MESSSFGPESSFGASQDNSVHSPKQSTEHDPGDDSSDDAQSQSRHSDTIDPMVFDEPSRPLSPDTSPQRSEDEVSVLVSDYRSPSRLSSQHTHGESPFTPMRPRFAFRNSSYVRAMQNNDNSPPHYHINSPPTSQQRVNRFPTPSRNSTPRSVRSSRSARHSTSPSKKPKKEYPLILLHVTILPIPQPYSTAVMERVLPPHIISNWKLLNEKATSTVLERGILIPHPREDYETLEERLLESLELVLPRILKCGHFHLSEEESQAILQDGEDLNFGGVESKDLDICPECDRPIRDGRYGTGEGNRRWDVKVYAANGLMRSGAWSAAWREMERVDVEIMPWLTEDMRRDLDVAKEEEAALIEEQQRQGHDMHSRSESIMDEERMKEIYGGGEPQDFIDGLQDEKLRNVPSPATAPFQQPHEIPLSTLLSNYVLGLAQDPRNIAIGVLTLLVFFLSMMAARSTSHQVLPVSHLASAPSIQHHSVASDSNSPQLSPISSTSALLAEDVPEMVASEPEKIIFADANVQAEDLRAHPAQSTPQKLLEPLVGDGPAAADQSSNEPKSTTSPLPEEDHEDLGG